MVEFFQGPWDGVKLMLAPPLRPYAAVSTVAPEPDVHGLVPAEQRPGFSERFTGPHHYRRAELPVGFVYCYVGRQNEPGPTEGSPLQV